MNLLIIALVCSGCGIAIGTCWAQGPLHISFDGPPLQPPATAYLVQQYFEADMWFRPLGIVGPGNSFGRIGGGVSFYPENGSAYIDAPLGGSLVFSDQYIRPFGLTSVDLAEYSTAVADAVTVPFVGYYLDGGTVTTSFTTDGVIDGTGPLADFETFYFGPEWSGLTRVEIPTYGWSLDNLVVVPEPHTAVFLIAGALAFGLWHMRRRS